MRHAHRPRTFLSLLALCALLPSLLDAATITVDGVTCTLGDAIVAANTDAAVGGCPAGDAGHDTIVLDADVTLAAADPRSTLFTGSPSGLPDVTDDLTITAGVADLIQRDPAFACDVATADPTFRFLINASGVLTLENLRFENGCFVTDFAATSAGGGIYSDFDAEIHLLGVTVRNLAAFTTLEGLIGGFLWSEGPTRVVDSVFEDVTLTSADAVLGGVLASTQGTFTLANTQMRRVQIAASNVVRGGALYLGNSSPSAVADLVVEDVTVESDSFVTGGALYVRGLGASAQVTVNGATVRRVAATATGSTVRGGALYFENGGARDVRALAVATVQAAAQTDCLGGALYAAPSGQDFSIEGLTVDDAACVSAAGAARGGGLYIDAAMTQLRDCAVRGARAAFFTEGAGGALYARAVIDRIARCSFVDSAVEPVDATSRGSARGGGVFFTDFQESARLRNVTVAGNLAVAGDGVVSGAAGGDASGGGLAVGVGDPTPVFLTHVTLADNMAIAGAGADGFADGVAEGGGLHVGDFAQVAVLDNTILADGIAVAGDGAITDSDCLIRGTLGSQGFNLVEHPGDGCDFAQRGDIVGLDPRLRVLGDYGCAAPLPDGGCLPTMAIDQTSWAVDGGSCADSNVAFDARGFLRRQDVAVVPNSVDGCDVGAYEAFDSDADGVTDAVDPCPNDPGDACVLFADGFETAATHLWSAIESGG
ncbi:MAG: choice-of-anchor Q domain-containing protein [Acidobacteriota bacterium]